MRRDIVIFDSFKEAEEADRAYLASLTPQERVDLLLQIVADHQERTGDTTERLERVYRVVELARS